jgi:hypothetical protein
MTAGWEDRKKIWKQNSQAEHEQMSKLFRENRFSFELERKKQISACINNARNQEKKEELQRIQNNLDRILNNSGSEYNRFVLMQMLFWDQVTGKYSPLLNSLKVNLDSKNIEKSSMDNSLTLLGG